MNIFFCEGTITPNSFRNWVKFIFLCWHYYLVTDSISVDPVSKVAVWVLVHVEMAGDGSASLDFLPGRPDWGSQPLELQPGLVSKLEQRRLWSLVSGLWSSLNQKPDKCIKSISSTSTYHHVKYSGGENISIVSAHIVAVFRDSIQYPVSCPSGLNARNSLKL